MSGGCAFCAGEPNHHQADCVIEREARRQAQADAADLAGRPAGSVLTRPLTAGERTDLGAQFGWPPVPAGIARGVTVRRIALAPDLLLTAVDFRGSTRSLTLTTIFSEETR